MTNFIQISGKDKNEIEELSKLATEIVKQHFDPIIGPKQNDYMIGKFQTPEAIAQQIQQGYRYYWVIDQDETAGFMAFYPRTGKMYLSKFYVAKHFRGRHLAAKMFEFICRETKKEQLSAIFLNVNRNNSDVIQVYEHLGFVIVGQEKNDIGNGFFMDDFVLEYAIEQTFLFGGDSITDADHLWEPQTDYLGNGYVHIISEKLPNAKILNRGHDGFTASMMRRFWESECISQQPDIVTILVGINDLAEHLCWGGSHGAEEYEKNLEWLIKKTTKHTNAKIILMEPFIFPRPAEYINWMEPLAEFREKVRSLANKYRTGFVPLWDIFQEAQKQYKVDELTVDGIHLTRVGHEILADYWLQIYREECTKNEVKGETYKRS